jgi:hypothetical protein
VSSEVRVRKGVPVIPAKRTHPKTPLARVCARRIGHTNGSVNGRYEWTPWANGHDRVVHKPLVKTLRPARSHDWRV